MRTRFWKSAHAPWFARLRTGRSLRRRVLLQPCCSMPPLRTAARVACGGADAVSVGCR